MPFFHFWICCYFTVILLLFLVTKIHILSMTVSHFQSRNRAPSLEEQTGLATVTIRS